MKTVTYFTVQISDEQRDKIVQALGILGDEYRKIAGQIVTRLADNFNMDAQRVDALREMFEGLLDTEQLNKKVVQLLDRGAKIEAIKLVREQTRIGLKEAKEYVDDLPTKITWEQIR